MFFKTKRKRVLLLGTTLILFTSCGLMKKKKSSSGNDQSQYDPVYMKNYPVNTYKKSYDSTYTLPLRSKPPKKLSVVSLDGDGKEIGGIVVKNGVGNQPFPRHDGLTDYVISVPFVINEKNKDGFDLVVTVVEEGKDPLVMKTEVTVDETIYYAPHKFPESIVHGSSVFTDYSFWVKSDGDLLTEITRALQDRPDPGINDVADSDLLDVKKSWERDGDILIQKGPAVIAFNNPGKATIRTNGYPLTLSGSNWQDVTVEVGKCGREENSADCNNLSPSVLDLFLLTANPPKVIAQKVVIDGFEIGAFDGKPGVAATETTMMDICSKTIHTLDIPKSKKRCTLGMDHLNGDNVLAKFVLRSSAITNDVFMDTNQIEEFLELYVNEDEGQYKFLKGDKSYCDIGSCVFDFHGDKVELVDGIFAPSEEYRKELEEVVLKDKPSYYSGGYRLKKEHSSSFYFNLTTNDWTKNVAGYEGVWAKDSVKEWAHDKCSAHMNEKVKEWETGEGVRLPSVDSIESLAGNSPRIGQDDNNFSLSKKYDKWIIANTKASAVVQATSTNGNFNIEFEAEKNGVKFQDDSLVLSDMNGIKTLSIGGEALQALRPVTRELRINGYSGEDGFDTASVASFGRADLTDHIKKELTGKAGPMGEPWIRDNYVSGELTYSYVWVDENGNEEEKLITNAEGHPCHNEELYSGQCYITYKSRYAKIENDGPNFLVRYTTKEILGNFIEPWVGYDRVQGLGEMNFSSNYEKWLKDDLGLKTNNDLIKDSSLALSFALQKGNSPGGNQRGDDPARFDPSSSVNFYGTSFNRPHEFNGFLKKALGKAAKAGKQLLGNVVRYHTNPISALDDMVNSTGRVHLRNEIVFRDPSQQAFIDQMTDTSGRHIYKFEAWKELPVDSQDLLCSDIKGAESGSFNAKISDYIPRSINANISKDLIIDATEPMYQVKRKVNLKDTITDIQKHIEPVLRSNSVYKNVESTCTEETCYTDLEFLSSIRIKERCESINLSLECETRSETPVYKKGRIVWFDGHGDFIGALAKQCNDQIRDQNDKFESLIKKLGDGEHSPFITALSVFDRKTLEDLNRFAESVKNLKDMYWASSRVPEDLGKYLDEDKLKKYTVSLENLYIGSSSRKKVVDAFESHGFTWDQIKPGKVGGIAIARKNYDAFPTREEVKTIKGYVYRIVEAMMPKIKNLSCFYDIKGDVRYYPDPNKKDSDAEIYPDLFPHLANGTLRFEDSFQSALSVSVKEGKTWELNGGENIAINISSFKASPIHDKLELSLLSTARSGKEVKPLSKVIDNCENLAFIAEKYGVNYPKEIFVNNCGLN